MATAEASEPTCKLEMYQMDLKIGGPVIKNLCMKKMVVKEKNWSGRCCQKFMASQIVF
jgi:hypothetical protein